MKLLEQRTALAAQLRDLNRAQGDHVPTEALYEMRALREQIEALDERLRAEALTAEPEAPTAPLLADGGGNGEAFTRLRSIDGREIKAFRKGQRMAPAAYRHAGDMSMHDFGRGLAALISGHTRGHEEQVRALSTQSNPGGGIMVPESISSEIIDLARAKSRVFQAGAVTVDMPAQDVRLVTLEADPTIDAVGEGALVGADDPEFGSVLLAATKHGCMVKVSNELLADGIGAGEAVMASLSSAWATYLDGLALDFLLDSPSVPETGTVGAVTYDDLLLSQYTIRSANFEPNALIHHPRAGYALSLLKDSTTDAYKAPPAALASLALLDSTAIADSKMIAGQWDQLVVGVRGGLSIALSTEAGEAFQRDETWVRLLWRGDVNVRRAAAFHRSVGLTY